jgi:hypothetical protein
LHGEKPDDCRQHKNIYRCIVDFAEEADKSQFLARALGVSTSPLSLSLAV